MAYDSFKSYTIKCPVGETGPSVTQSASASSIISQWDADNKAYGLAQRLAFEFLMCTFPPTPEKPVFCSAPVTKTASSEAGYVPQTFSVTFSRCDFYSNISQEAADAGAALAAQIDVNHYRDTHQKPIFYNHEQSFSSSCAEIAGPNHDASVYTTTIAAGARSSETSQAAADYLAYNEAKANTIAVLASTCVAFYFSAALSYTAECTMPLVGAKVTVTYAAGEYKSYVSQADADATALAMATTVANSSLVCASGFYNVSQTIIVYCEDVYGHGWYGTDSLVTVPAGAYSGASQIIADTDAINAGTAQATAALVCHWGGTRDP